MLGEGNRVRVALHVQRAIGQPVALGAGVAAIAAASLVRLNPLLSPSSPSSPCLEASL